MPALEGAVVLVVGAGSGGAGVSNGQAAALAYARAGARVACADVNGAAAEATAEAILGEGGTALAITADVTSDTDVTAMVQRASDELGPIQVLHNNVGVTVLGGVTDLPIDQWRRGFDINVDSVFRTCQQVLPGMLERGSGAIVNVSSIAAIRDVGYDYPAYQASKAAVNQLTTAIALRYADRGIRANSIAPGLIDTPLVRAQLSSQAASIEELLAVRHAASPTGRMGTPWDVANAAVFLASDQAAYINGVCLPVDGGMSMRAM